MLKSFIRTQQTPTLKEIYNECGRFYETPDGKKFPSVTTVLKDYNKEGIDKWIKRVGEVAAKKEGDYALDRGTKFHNLIESYLLTDKLDNIEEYPPMVKIMFQNLRPKLELIDNIHLMETTLFSNTLKVAGRVDVIGEYDGKLSIIDFKTSKRSKKLEWIKSYFMQTSAYAFMYHEMTELLPKQIVILIAGEQDLSTQVFVDNPGNHIRDFKKEVDKFYKKML